MVKLKTQVKRSIEQRPDQLKGLDKQFWLSLLSSVNKEEDFVKNYYNPILEKFNADTLGLRYNQCIWYFDRWVNKSPSNYWLTIIRNPYDRAMSNIITHNWSKAKCALLTQIYGEKIEKIKNHPQFVYVYYEDLVKNPEEIIKSIYNQIGIKLEKVNLKDLKGADGKDYRNQGSNVKLKKGDHRKGEKFSGIYNTSVNKTNFLAADLSKTLNKYINKYPIYKRYL